jgi:hypothetical protein
MSSTRVRAAVVVAPNQTELREFALPEVPPDAGLTRVLTVAPWRAELADAQPSAT